MGVVVALCATPASAQSPDAVRAALLAPVRWTMMWPQAHPPWAGVATVFFEARGERLVASIENHTGQVTCERDVAVAAEEARFDLCRESGLVLRYRPQDTEIPFRGRTALRWYVFTPR
jgi:hypothetical protein